MLRYNGRDGLLYRLAGAEVKQTLFGAQARARRARGERSLLGALALSFWMPGAGSVYAGHPLSGVRSFVLVAAATAADYHSSWWGFVLLAAASIYNLTVTYNDVLATNRGYRHYPSFFSGYRQIIGGHQRYPRNWPTGSQLESIPGQKEER